MTRRTLFGLLTSGPAMLCGLKKLTSSQHRRTGCVKALPPPARTKEEPIATWQRFLYEWLNDHGIGFWRQPSVFPDYPLLTVFIDRLEVHEYRLHYLQGVSEKLLWQRVQYYPDKLAYEMTITEILRGDPYA